MAFRDKSMRCPRCGKDLVQYEDRDKWRCKECRGALVGADQLVVEIGDLARHVIDDDADPARPAIHPCPACAFPMTPYTIGEGKGAIELDRCVDDTLVWFDGGEIGKVRELPQPEDPELLTNTLGFVFALREQMRAERAGEHDDIPPAEPTSLAAGEWDKRAMCADGACTGVIGDDGKCKVCGAAPAPAPAAGA